MPGLSRQTARPEEQLLTESGRDVVVITLAVAVTAGLFAVMADHAMMSRIQQLDDAWLRLMVSGHDGPLTALAKIFNILGLVYVTLPVRIAVAGFLAVRRQWWHLAAFAAAVVLSEILIGLLKASYDRVKASRVAGGDERCVVPVRARRRRVSHRGRGSHRAGTCREAHPVGAGRGAVLDPDGPVPRVPGCALAV